MTASGSFWNGKRVIVTGGAGFIGSHLVEQLVNLGAHITIIDNLLTGRRENLAAVADRVDFREADLRTLDWSPFLEAGQYDTIFHLAANAYVPPSVETPYFDLEINFLVTFRLLDAMRAVRWPGALVYASTAAVYGEPQRSPVSEDDITIPISPYGAGKLASERYAAVFSRLYKLRITTVRFFSTYGPRQRKQVVYDLMERIRQNDEELFIYGDGTQYRDFNYVEDAAQAALVAGEHAPMRGEVHNAGAGTGCTIGDLATTLCQYMGKPLRFKYSGANRPGDPEKLVVNITKLSGLGYQPRVSLPEGLRRTVDWFVAAQGTSRA